MFNKILFPVIMNEYTEQIINCLGGLSRNGTKEVQLFHVMSVSDLARGNVNREQDENLLKKWKAELEESGIQAEYRIIQGIPWLEIVELAERSDYSFVMLGSHGSTFLDKMFLGSVTENVVHHTSKPVFIFKLKKDLEADHVRYCVDIFRKILYVTDFSPNAEACLPFIDQMKNTLYQELHILHVQDTRELRHAGEKKIVEFQAAAADRMDEMRNRFLKTGFEKVETLTRAGYAMTEILNYAKEADCSIIVLGKKGTSNVREMLLGGVAETVIHKSEIPVFLIGNEGQR